MTDPDLRKSDTDRNPAGAGDVGGRPGEDDQDASGRQTEGQAPPPPTTLVQRLYTIHLPLLVIAIGVLVSVGFIAADRWRRGMIAFGLVTLLAALLRLVLPEERAGQLVVRSRAFDVAFLTILGALVVWLAGSINPLGTG